MLTRFTVGNFRSFDKNQTLSLIANTGTRHNERLFKTKDMNLLKFGAIFGANAAGKSNFIKAIDFAQRVICRGTETYLLEEYKDSYYRINPLNREKTSYFEFEMCIDDVIYAYGFEMVIFTKQITEEWLIQLNQEKDIEVFTRNTITGQVSFNTDLLAESFDKRMSLYLNDLKTVQNKTFLSDIVTNKDDLYKSNPKLLILKTLYRKINDLNISYPETTISGYDCFASRNIDLLLKAITSFKTGISGIIQTEISKEQALDKAPMNFRKMIDEAITRACKENCEKPSDKCVECGFRFNNNGRLIFVTFTNKQPVFTEVAFEHFGVKNVPFSLEDESDGTQRLLDLLSVILNQEEDSVFIIDEIDRSLHPQLTMHFIQTFLQISEEKNIQLIITTHESHLLNLDLLRQDEIFLVEMNKTGASNLYPFDRFKERFDKKIEKPYLDGRYGGVPIFDTFFSPLGAK